MAFVRAKKSGQDSQTWNKEVQTVIEGVYTEKKVDVAGKPGSHIYVIENDEGRWAVWSSKVLNDYFENIELGSKVRIEYLGKQKTKNGLASFNNFVVDVDVEE